MTENNQPQLLVLGELNMDLILDKVESFPELEKEKIAEKMNLTLGSSSAIFASNIARLGVKTNFCGMVGNDNFGAQVVRELEEYDIKTTYVKTDEEQKTGLTVIIRQGNSRAMVTYPGAMTHFSFDDIPPDAFKQVRHLHISSIFLQPAVKKDLFKIIEKAKAHDMTISIDPQWDPAEKWDLDLGKLLAHIDFFIPNEAEFLQFTKSQTVEDGLQKLHPHARGSIIVKLGTNGAAYMEKNQMKAIPAFVNEDPVDAIGAGDSFNAGFIYRFLRGASIEKCIQFGNITGAISTTKAGGTAAITSLNEVLRIAKDKFSINNIDEITR